MPNLDPPKPGTPETAPHDDPFLDADGKPITDSEGNLIPTPRPFPVGESEIGDPGQI